MKKTRIKITHQIDKTVHYFFVVNEKNLSYQEVERIKKKMNVEKLFIAGRMYH